MGLTPLALRLGPWLASSLLASACFSQPAPDASLAVAYAREPAELERGRRLFLGACAGLCHAPPGGGRAEAPELFDCEWRHGATDSAIFETISQGVPGTPMVGFGATLDDRDIWRLIAYLHSASRCSPNR